MKSHPIYMQYFSKGFSLLEVLITIVVVSIGLLAIGVLQTNVIGSSAQSKIRTEALTIAQRQIEDYRQFLNSTSTSWMSFSTLPTSAAGSFADYTIIYASGAASTGEMNITVTVDWSAFAKKGEMSSVEVASKVAYVNPNSIANSVKTPPQAMVNSPTGRAYLGEGSIDLDAVPAGDKSTNEDGTVEVVQGDDRLLVVPSASGDDNVVLTLEDACVSGTCTDFVKISGRIYMDQGMASPPRTLDEIFVTASDAGYCHMWLPGRASLSLPGDAAITNTSSPPSYRFVYYTCYLGGGWHGNIGVLYAGGVTDKDFACMGDPTASDADDRQTYGVRRAYRGMLASGAEHTSIGIRDATVLQRQDFVISKKSPIVTQTACNGPMTRTDSVNSWLEYSQTASAGVSSPTGHDGFNSGISGKLFAGVPTDFVCLNEIWYDYDGAGPSAAVRALDDFEAPLTALSSCPYDPTDPPVTYVIAGEVTYPSTAPSAALSSFVVDTDGDICARGDASTLTFVASGAVYKETYRCLVYSEEGVTNWNVKMNARSYDPGFYCSLPGRNNQGSVNYSYSSFSGGYALNSENIKCEDATSHNVTGNVTLPSGVALKDLSLNVSDRGYCTTSESAGVYSYSCFVYPNGSTWNGSITADIANPAYECNDEVALPKSTTGNVGASLQCYYAPMTLSVAVTNNATGSQIKEIYLTEATSYGGDKISCAEPSKNSNVYSCLVPDIGAVAGGKLVIVASKNDKKMQLTGNNSSSSKLSISPTTPVLSVSGGLYTFNMSVSPLPVAQETYSLSFTHTN